MRVNNDTSIVEYRQYLDGLIADSVIALGKLDYTISRDVFLKALKDYFDEKISANYISSISSAIYYDFNKPHIVSSTWPNEFASILTSATELEYYIAMSNKGDSGSKRRAALIQKSLRRFYKKTVTESLG